ncbi:MAG TPA: hypothetical protein VFX31_03725, partial [Ktedonobacterales bacterium]|nr:hypothetical protein [Ktedonobacterales bacterium]
MGGEAREQVRFEATSECGRWIRHAPDRELVGGLKKLAEWFAKWILAIVSRGHAMPGIRAGSVALREECV